MRLWVTRSQPGAARTAERLAALGHQPLVAPVLRVERSPVAAPSLAGVAALAFTSAAGVEAFAALSATPITDRERALPVFTVGAATARAARLAGWSDVRSADADAASLARLIADHLAPRAGAPARAEAPVVLAPGAREPAFDLPAALATCGIAARAAPLYATLAAPSPPAAAVAALRGGALDGVLVHSPSAGRALRAYAEADPAFARALAPLCAFALSKACAAALSDALADPIWPPAPRERDLLALPPLGARPALR